MIIPLWQSEAASSHRLAAAVGAALGEPATHTGTLDPLASGVVVVLSGADRFVKGALHWPKTYSFRILWGVSTDSGDALGLISQIRSTTHLTALSDVLAQFPRAYQQTVPAFSAQRVAGTTAALRARTGTAVPRKTRAVQLSPITLDSTDILTRKKLLTQLTDRVSAVTGDFRQTAVLKNWHTAQLPDSFIITQHTVQTSPGTYIRQLTQDIAAELRVPALTIRIVRTKNGPFSREDCLDFTEMRELASSAS